jgi:hypothetical protein
MQEVKIQRKLGTALVNVIINDDEVGVSVPFGDYMELLLGEMGQIATLMTKEQLRKKLLEAAERLEYKCKSQVKPWGYLVKR